MGKPYAGFDEAGAGNGLSEYRASPRPYPWGPGGEIPPGYSTLAGIFEKSKIIVIQIIPWKNAEDLV